MLFLKLSFFSCHPCIQPLACIFICLLYLIDIFGSHYETFLAFINTTEFAGLEEVIFGYVVSTMFITSYRIREILKNMIQNSG